MFERMRGFLFPSFILTLLYIAFCWPFFSSTSTINIFPDNEWFLSPIFSHFSSTIRNLDWPLWMPSVLGGLPLFNSPQISPYYPMYFLFFDIWTNPLQSIRSLHNITLLHILVFQINCFVLLRQLKISTISTLLGTMFAVFNLTTLEIVKWGHLIASYSWLPLYLVGVFKLLDSRWSGLSMITVVVGFSMMAFAMVGQPIIFAGLFTCTLMMGRVLFHTHRLSLPSALALIRVAFTLTLAMLVSSPVLFPVIADLGLMVRWVSPTHAIVGHASIPFEHFLTDQLALSELPYFLIPSENRHAISHPFIGVLPIALAVSALALRTRHWVILPIFIFCVYCFVSAFGSNMGMAYVNHSLPVVNKIREPSYFLLPLNLCVGILAGFGFDSLTQRLTSPRERAISTLVFRFLSLCFVTLILFTLFSKLGFRTSALDLSLALLFIFFLLAHVLPIIGDKSAKASLGALFLVSIAAQSHTVSWRSPTITDSDYLRLDLVKLEAAFSRIRQLDANGEFRVIFGGGINNQVAAMLASYQKIRTLNSFVNPLPFSQFRELYHHAMQPNKYINGLGAKYLLCRECGGLERYGYHFLEEIGGHSIYVNEDVLPHFFATNKVIYGTRTLEDYIKIVSEQDLRTRPVILPEGVLSKILPNSSQIECTIRNNSTSENEFLFIVYCPENSFFVLNEFFSTSWKVSINETPTAPIRVNGNQIGVQLAAGSSVVRFRYEPWPVKFSWYLAIGGIAILLIALWWTHPPFPARPRKV